MRFRDPQIVLWVSGDPQKWKNESKFNLKQEFFKSNIPSDSAKRILQKLRDAGIIEIIGEGKGRIPAVYQFTRLMKIAERENDWEWGVLILFSPHMWKF